MKESLFRLQGKELPRHVFVLTRVKDSANLLVRKLPVLGIKDWLLIYEDTLFLLAVKDRFDEIEFRVVVARNRVGWLLTVNRKLQKLQ